MIKQLDCEKQIARKLKEIMDIAKKYDPEMRATINFEYTEELYDVMEEVGLKIVALDRKKYKDLRLGEITDATIREIGYIPDVFIDRESGKKNYLRLLGKSPKDLYDKLELFV